MLIISQVGFEIFFCLTIKVFKDTWLYQSETKFESLWIPFLCDHNVWGEDRFS